MTFSFLFRITILAFQQGKIDSPKILDYMLINKFISAYSMPSSPTSYYPADGSTYQAKGWCLYFSPELLRGTQFGRHIKEAHPTNPVEGCADANPKTMLPNDT